MNENRVDNQLLKQPQFLSKKRMKYGPHGTVRFVKEIIKKLIPEIRTLRREGGAAPTQNGQGVSLTFRPIVAFLLII